MKAFVLAAGLGTRLKPLTDQTPKPMLKIAGKPLLEHQVNWLKSYGVTDILMNLYYFPDQIKDHFGDGSKFGVNIDYIVEDKLSGTAGPIIKKREFFDEQFFVIYGDNLTNINLTKLKSFHEDKGGIATIALYYEQDPTSKGIVELDSDSRVLNFKEKPKAEEVTTHWSNTGIYVCEPEIVNHIEGDFVDFGHDLFPELLSKNIPLYGYQTKEYLLDIGTHDNFQKAQNDISTIGI